MTHPHDLALTQLARHALLPLQGGTGRGVGVFSGSVWITEEGEPEDHVLGPGESLVLRKPGLVLVEALQDAQLILFANGGRVARDGMTAAAGAQAKAQGAGTGRSATNTPAPLSVAAYERIARELRRQAKADALAWLVRTLGRSVGRSVKFGRSLGGSVGRSIGRSVGRLIGRSVRGQFARPTLSWQAER